MMRQFEIQSPCGDGVVAPDLEECDDGNTEDEDGCSSNCKLEKAPTPSDSNKDKTDARVGMGGCSLVQVGARQTNLSWFACLLVSCRLVSSGRRRKTEQSASR